MFGRATITLGIGPHSSQLCILLYLLLLPFVVNKVYHYKRCTPRAVRCAVAAIEVRRTN